MYRIRKKFQFSASHQIEGLPEGHPCGRLHGHNYEVEVVLAGETLVSPGFILDYGELKPFREFIDGKLDHRHLNDILPVPTTAEHLAQYLGKTIQRCWPDWPLEAVRVSETPKTWAEWWP